MTMIIFRWLQIKLLKSLQANKRKKLNDKKKNLNNNKNPNLLHAVLINALFFEILP